MTSRTRERSPLSTLGRGVGRVLPVCAVCGILVATAARDALAQADKGQKSVRTETLTTDDGFPIAITYYEATGSNSKDAPVVVLLHGENGNRLVYTGKDGLAEQLQRQGYAVIAVDLRKHGESKRSGGGASDLRPNDYKFMAYGDLPAVKDFIYQEHQDQKLNMRKTAIVASDMSAAVAMGFAVSDWLKKPHPDGPTPATSTPRGQDIRALVLLSPVESLPGLPGARAAMALKNPRWGVAFLIAYGEKDVVDRGGQAAKKLHSKIEVPQNKNRVYLQKFPYRLRGTDLLGKGIKTEAYILAFLKKHLQDLKDPWQDRRSRLLR